MSLYRWTGKAVLLLFAFVALSCSGDDSGDAGSVRLTGKADAGNAQVWLDMDNDFIVDPGEPNSRTEKTGKYTLYQPPGASAEGMRILVRVEAGESVTMDGRLSSDSYLLVSSPDGRQVSVWATLVSALAASGDAADLQEARDKVRGSFNLPSDFDFDAVVPESRDRWLEGLTQVVQSAYAQKAAESITRPRFESRDIVFTAARQVMQSSAVLLPIADRQPLLSPPVLGDSPAMSSDIFHGDFSAIPINTNMAYGKGLDEASYNLKGSCVEDGSIPFQGICANEYDYTFQLVQSVDEMRKHLGIGASAKAGVSVAGYDVVSVSGGFNFIRDTQFKDDSLYILFNESHRICGYSARSVLKAEWEEKFTENYEEFRSTCGDRYLFSFTSGGEFSALIEVQVGEDSERKEMRLDLSGKVLGVTVYDKSWKETLADIDRRYKTRTRVWSNRSQYSDNFLNIAQVFAQYDEFAAQMRQAECDGPKGWKTCGYLATFSGYETITDRPAGNAAALKDKLGKMRALENYFISSSELLESVDEILMHPDDYNIGESVDGFSEPNFWTIEKLENWRAEVEHHQSTAAAQWDRCRGGIDQCTKGPVDLGLPPWLELKRELPTRKFIFPQSCESLAEQHEETEDGEYYLYLGGDYSKGYRGYCRGMTTGEPKTFLPLANTSANRENPDYNYSSFHYLAGEGSRGVLFRTFDALRVEPFINPDSTTPYLRVVPGQSEFSQWFAAPGLDPASEVIRALSVMEAQDQEGVGASANLSLEGTPFRLSSSLSIKSEDDFTDPVVRIDSIRKNIDVSITSGKAAVAGMILLEWDKDSAPE